MLGPSARKAGVVAPAEDAPITPLGALLVERGDLSGQQLRDALGAQTSGGKRLGEILVELGVISERVLGLPREAGPSKTAPYREVLESQRANADSKSGRSVQ